MKKMYRSKVTAILLIILMIFTNCLTIIAQDANKNVTTTPKATEGASITDASVADHLDVSAKLTAALVYNGTSYTQNLTLTKEDFASANITLTAKQGETEVKPKMDLSNLTVGTNQIRVGGSYPVGTKENPVIYTITLKKNVTFKDGDGTDLITHPMTFKATFHYWMDNNTCFELTNEGQVNTSWKEGKFIEKSGLGVVFAAASDTYTVVNQNPQQNEGGTSTENPNKNEGEAPTENPDKNEGDTPTENPDKNEGDTPTENLEQNEGNTPTENPEQNEGNTPTQKPDKPTVNPVTWSTASIKAMKILTGRNLKAGEFMFEVVDKSGAVIASGTNEAANAGKQASITFTSKEFTYDKPVEAVYTIREVKGELKGVTYDTNTFTVKVVVTEKEGVLSAQTVYDAGKIVFNSKYEAADVNLTLSGTVTLDAGGRKLKAGEFTINVIETDKDGKKLENAAAKTVTNDASGKFSLKYTYGLQNIGTHYYKVTQTAGKETGMTYAAESYLEAVEVKDNGDGTLSASSANNTKLNFTNKYKASGNIAIQAKTTLKGRTLKKDEFQYKVTAVTKGAPMPKNTTVKNKADGTITFAQITFNEDAIGKTYEYRINQVKGTLSKVTYDTTAYTVKVTVTDKGNGKLEVKQATTPTFSNVYTGTVAAKTGDQTSVLLYGIMTGVSGLTAIAAFGKKRKAAR